MNETRDHAESVDLCELVFGPDWEECVTEHGRNRLYERYVLGDIPDIAEWDT